MPTVKNGLKDRLARYRLEREHSSSSFATELSRVPSRLLKK